MLDTEFVRYLASLGTGGLIAGLMFMVYRKDMKLFEDRWRGQAELWKGQAEILMSLVRENTRVMTSLGDAVKAFHHRLDNDDLRR